MCSCVAFYGDGGGSYNIKWNYGLFPQTWEDPSHSNPEVEDAFGDNDPGIKVRGRM